ncbi:MAG: hypothetical protein U5R49_12160 [Deltaproteobacteria bacterium]|nr:hypothetical protein [Deltaproteobacteria bacterium]
MKRIEPEPVPQGVDFEAKDRRKGDLMFNEAVEEAVESINEKWGYDALTMRDVPEDIRRRCFDLEEEMFKAANAGDFNAARSVLREWELLWNHPHKEAGAGVVQGV